jgi:hypothetical protein
MRDLRTPIGIFFIIAGLIVAITGIAAGNPPLENANVNLYCGVPILIFGGVMLWLARRSS